jgi:hypothetical protein
MSEGYIQTELLECNRLRSEEALGGNEENPASWTNTLSAVYDLEAGDKVSLYNAFIAERGAGNVKTIEIKGKSLGKFKTFEYIEETIDRQGLTNIPINSTITPKSEIIELRDNEVNLINGFYKNTNGTGYTTLPRRFISQTFEFTGEAVGAGTGGSSTTYAFTEPDKEEYGYISPVPDPKFIIKGDYFRECTSKKYKVINNNDKFTLYATSGSVGTNTRASGISTNVTLSPENNTYYRYQTKLNLSVPSGFNSAQFIADDLSRQLRKVVSTHDLIFTEDKTQNEVENNGPNRVVSKTLESETYKTFNCMTSLLFPKTEYDKVIAGSASTWYNNYNVVGLKRPELYDTGKLINMSINPSKSESTYQAVSTGTTGQIIIVKQDSGLPIDINLTDYALVEVEILGHIQGPIPANVTAWTVLNVESQIRITIDSEYSISGTVAEDTNVKVTFYNKSTATGYTLNTQDNGLMGSFLRTDYDYTVDNEPMRLAIPYTKENLLKLKNFINAQEEYPEIWKSWNASLTDDDDGDWTYGDGDYYSENDTIDNTRFFHMNTVQNPRLTEEKPTIQGELPNSTTSNTVVGTNPSGNNIIKIAWDGTESGKIILSEYYLIYAVGTGIPSTSIIIDITYTTGSPNFMTLTLSNALTSDINTGSITLEYFFHGSAEDPHFRDVGIDRAPLGSSLFRNTKVDIDTNYELTITGDLASPTPYRYSKILLTHYIKEDRDIFYENPSLEKNQLTYGCFGKESFTYKGVTSDYINIYPNSGSRLGLFPVNWFDAGYLGDLVDEATAWGFIEGGRKIGYDMHFTSPANPAISLYNGKTATFPNYYGSQFSKTFSNLQWGNTPLGARDLFKAGIQPIGATVEGDPDDTNILAGFLNRRYVGADNPKINWDGEHFNISDLHTPENLAARSADGGNYGNFIFGEDQTAFTYVTADPPTDAGDIIYKINPKADINEFCPALAPYIGQYTLSTKNGVSASGGVGPLDLELFNTSINPYTIYDSKSGIVFEDMGFEEDTWDSSLWATLGFTYEQFHSTINNRLSRVNDNNVNSLKYPTTNAEVVTTDTKLWNTNDKGVPLYSDNIPCPFALFTYDSAGTALGAWGSTGDKYLQRYPEINQKTQSIQLTAQKFPISMIKGYYTIRSDIVPQSIFVGGRSNITNMPIVGIIDKMNPQNDYYFGSETGVEFVIGRPTKMSSITCSIHDPDGSFANVGNSSSIIFKIQRQIKTSFNIIEEILENEKKK